MALDVSSAASESREELQSLYQMALEIGELQDLRLVLNTALRHCLELTGSQFGFIGLNSSDGRALDVVAIEGFVADPSFHERFHLIPLRPNVFARVVLENRTVRTDDATTDPDRVGQPRGHPPVRAFLGVPLRSEGRPIGMIGVANRAECYAIAHEQLLMTYAGQVAITIRNCQLLDELRAAKAELERKVEERTEELHQATEALAQHADKLKQLLAQTVTIQEQERARIAQDMHDGVNQLIIGAMLEVTAARESISSWNMTRVQTALQRVRAVLGQVDNELKRLIYDLRPPILDAQGLAPAIPQYAKRFQTFSGLPCTTKISGLPRRLDAGVEMIIWRVMQEALQNAAIHAHADWAWVHLHFQQESVQLDVGDNGCGFELHDALHQHETHLGVVGMFERAEAIQGHLTIETAPRTGTLVHLYVPTIMPGGRDA